MKKIVIFVIAAVLAAALFLSCQKQSDEKKSGAGSDNVASEKAGDSDEKACLEARKENTRAAWEKYLKKFPEGKCAEEGRTIKNKFKKIGGFEWSDKRHEAGSCYGGASDEAEYCENLIEGGHDDWRLPDIDELRVLVQNHPGTVAGGTCKILTMWPAFDVFTDSCSGMEGKNFSRLGDTERLISSSDVEEYQTNATLFVDFSNGEISYENGNERNICHVRCVRQDDIDACAEARKEDTNESWEHYLSLFPNGKCSKEAKATLEDVPVCKRAKKANTRAVWEEYLKKFPNGKCAEEGKAVRNKFKKIGNFEWSDVIEYKYDEENKVVLCEDLEEDGHSDWREPNIEELRTLVQNHPGTVSEGECKIYGRENDERIAVEDEDDTCDGIEGENFSKLGDKGGLDSRTLDTEIYHGDFLEFSIYFETGGIYMSNGFGRWRCVRQDDLDACETARKYNEFYYWDFYLENYPDGRCAKEAKTVLDGLTCEAAEEYKKIYLEWYQYQFWKKYLERYPNGKCAKEAKAELEKLDENACKALKIDKYSQYWVQEYLEKYPGGKCTGEAKNKMKKIEAKEVKPENWSSGSKKAMSWKQAKSYCENLKENGSSDWRLPTISELRTLITDCKSTETGGACGVTDQCLSVGQCKNKACRGCESKVQHNTLGDKGFFWSSSISPDNKNAWYIDFTYGSVHNHSKSVKFVRCVR